MLHLSTPKRPVLHRTCLEWTRGACAAPGRVYTTGSWWAAPVHVYATEAYVASEWTCLHHRGRSCTWTSLDKRSLYCSFTCLHSNGLSWTWTYIDYRNLILNLATLQRHVLHLEVPTPHLPELYLDLSGQQNPCCIGLDVSTPQGASAATGRVYITKAYAIPGRVYTTWAWAAPGHVCTTEACFAPGCYYSIRACTEPRLVWTIEACAAPGRVYTSGA